jgi:hypothetical protein
MSNDFSVSQINTQGGFSVDEHIGQFVKLWKMILNVQMDIDIPDEITWKLNATLLASA